MPDSFQPHYHFGSSELSQVGSSYHDYLGARMKIYGITGRQVTGFEVDSPVERILLQTKGNPVYRVLDKENMPVAKRKFLVPNNN